MFRVGAAGHGHQYSFGAGPAFRSAELELHEMSAGTTPGTRVRALV
jgi:hypothetical protein